MTSIHKISQLNCISLDFDPPILPNWDSDHIRLASVPDKFGWTHCNHVMTRWSENHPIISHLSWIWIQFSSNVVFVKSSIIPPNHFSDCGVFPPAPPHPAPDAAQKQTQASQSQHQEIRRSTRRLFLTDQPISRKFGPHQLGVGPDLYYKLAPTKIT